MLNQSRELERGWWPRMPSAKMIIYDDLTDTV
jgi:hypothetical protein